MIEFIIASQVTLAMVHNDYKKLLKDMQSYRHHFVIRPAAKKMIHASFEVTPVDLYDWEIDTVTELDNYLFHLDQRVQIMEEEMKRRNK